MKLSPKSQALQALIEPAVIACGVDLWGVEFIQQGRKSMLRVYIDKADSLDATLPPVALVTPDLVDDALLISEEDDAGRGVSAEDCVAVSHQVSGVLDVNDPISGEYILEVSSPGWDRPFFSVAQMQAYVGQTVALRLIHAVENRRKVTGLLQSIENDVLTVAVDNTTFTVNGDNLDKAHLVYED